MLLKALAVMGKFSDIFADACEFTLSLNEGLLLLAKVTALHFNDLVEILNTASLNLDSSAAFLKLSLKSSMSAAQFVVNFILARDLSDLLASVGLNSFDFFLEAGESSTMLINLVLLAVRVFASFVAIKAFVTKDCFKLVELTAEGTSNTVSFVDASLKVAKLVLVVVNFGADFVAGKTEFAVILLLVVT